MWFDTAMRAAAFAFGMARRQGGRLIVAFVACHSVLAALGPAVAAAEHEATVRLYAELPDQIRSAAEELEGDCTASMIRCRPSARSPARRISGWTPHC